MEKVRKHHDKLKLLASRDVVERIGTVRTCTSDNSFMIAQGSHGTCVYLGIDYDDNPVAVKRVLTSTKAHSLSVEKEAEHLCLLKSRRSEYIVNYRHFELGNPFSYVILDLYEESLVDFVQRNEKGYLETHGPVIITEILNGLCTLHSGQERILHMDLKPENILVDNCGHMRLADFGISKILGNNQTTIKTGSKGTPGWMAAESLPKDGEMEGRFKRKSDIQVVGMISFYVLTKGEHPFGDTYHRTSNIIDGKPVDLEMLTNATARDFVEWLIQHNPEDRPYAEEALKHPFLQQNADEVYVPMKTSASLIGRAWEFAWLFYLFILYMTGYFANVDSLNLNSAVAIRSRSGGKADLKFTNSGNGGKISYISNKWYRSRLVVQYINDKNEVENVMRENSCQIEIPKNAKDIEVKFEILQLPLLWSAVKKYDRFKKCWSKPTEPHIFKYDKPVTRTFTISGWMYFEAVIEVEGMHKVGDM